MEAAEYGNESGQPFIKRYVWHFIMSFIEGVKLLFLSLGSFLHAIFPWILDFQLLKWRISMLKKLKEKLPNDPSLKKINFLD
jgi:hypothetical protein